ncbi:hypothetical protein PTKIN_Ptkin09bG0269700 [Pterospermum kingtungense]
METKWLWWVVLVLSVLSLEAGLSNGCLEQERLALLKLRPFFINLLYSSNWTEEKGSDCCHWERVECNGTTRRVTKLSLNFPNQYSSKWYLNASLFLPFEELRSLDLSANALIGCLENEGFGKLSKLRHLESLDLGLNYFDASSLSSLSEISSLKSLSLVQMAVFWESNPNDFDWLSRLSRLETLDLSVTIMTNNFLFPLSGLSSLRTLDVFGNSLSGTVDLQDFQNLTNLKNLYLGQNRIESFRSSDGNGGQIRLINLEELDLSQNHFDNSILAELSGFPNLKSLDLTQNQLQGSIDITEFCGLSNLETLLMGYNAVNKFVTSKEKRCLGKLKNLYLERIYTEQSISLVSLLEPFSSVKTLSLKDNIYINKTVVSQEVHVLSNVENLYLDNTPLDIDFLQSIGGLTSLKILSLNNCGLNASLPTQGWCYLKSLEELSLSGNGLEGAIGSCLVLFDISQAYDHIRNTNKYTANGFPTPRFYRFSSAEEEIEFSTKSASYTYKGQILDLFSGIDLSCNELSGIIPPELGNWSEVHAVNLSHNKLTGPIPPTFSELKQVESLDLSYNNLNGRIPPQLTELNSLAVFSVAHNNLSGPLPDMKAQFGTFDESSYEGNPLLCGPPLKNSCSQGDSPPVTPSPPSGGEEHDSIDMGAFYISFGASYAIILLAIASVLYINPYWRRTWFYLIEECSTAFYFFIGCPASEETYSPVYLPWF